MRSVFLKFGGDGFGLMRFGLLSVESEGTDGKNAEVAQVVGNMAR
jgi:hypothetical protein